MYREGAAQEEEEEVQPVGPTVQLHWFHLSGECKHTPARKKQDNISRKLSTAPKLKSHVSNEKDSMRIFSYSVATNKAILRNSLIFVNTNKLDYREAHYQMESMNYHL